MSRPSLAQRIQRRAAEEIVDPLDKNLVRPLRRLRNSRRDYRPIFVAGAMGSGTSLVAVALASRFDCAGVSYESAREVDAHSVLYLPPVSHFANVEAYARALYPADSWSPDSCREDQQRADRGIARGTPDHVIDKGPNANLVRAGFLAECFPDAPFLLVFRDPVVNVEGFRRKWPTFGDDSLAASIRFYLDIHERFLEIAETLDERLAVVEYECLVQRFDETVERLGQRFGLSVAKQQRKLRSRANSPGKGLRNVKSNRIEVVRDASEAAYSRLEAEASQAIREGLTPIYQRLKEIARTR